VLLGARGAGEQERRAPGTARRDEHPALPVPERPILDEVEAEAARVEVDRLVVVANDTRSSIPSCLRSSDLHELLAQRQSAPGERTAVHVSPRALSPARADR